MGTRRVVLGALPGGGYGLRVSLPGYDVINDDQTDVTKFSFNTAWTDLLRTWQYGMATTSPVLFPSLGYFPFIEVRQVGGGVAYDDRPSGAYTQARCVVSYDRFTWSNSAGPQSIFYIVFKERAE